MTSQDAGYVVGLGNPGRRYRRTRHNLGFEVVELLADRWQAPSPRRTFAGRLWQGDFAGRPVRLLAPETYMNDSGRSVAEMVRFYKVDPAQLLIVLDDMALEPGSVRLRARGSAGGHNGLADVLDVLGTREVARLRLGIGEPPPGMDGVDYVLGKITDAERAAADEAIETACRVVEDWLTEGTEAAMNRHN